MQDVRLRPLRDDELPDYLAVTQANYERSLIEEAYVPPDEARAKAERDTASLLPDGLATEGHFLYAIEDVHGERVGSLHYAERPRGSGDVWLYYVVIDERFRGRGLGRAAMRRLEDDARERGFRRIALNVWVGNGRARQLYRSLDYREVSVHMTKSVGGD